jgi:hypothetical protein
VCSKRAIYRWQRTAARKPHVFMTVAEGRVIRMSSKGKLAGFRVDSLDVKQKKAFDTGGRIGGIFDWLGKK